MNRGVSRFYNSPQGQEECVKISIEITLPSTIPRISVLLKEGLFLEIVYYSPLISVAFYFLPLPNPLPPS